jgi:hypothetical protein
MEDGGKQGGSMAYDVAHMENPHNGRIRSAPLGFSWTTFFFGPLPMLFRGAWKWFFIVWLTAMVTFGLAMFYWIFTINRYYLSGLIEDGYRFRGSGRTPHSTVESYARMRLPMMEESQK